MRYTHFPTPWDEHRSSQRVRFYTVLSSGDSKAEWSVRVEKLRQTAK